jgi:hypothetical protein
MERLTKRQSAIIGAYTGITMGPFSAIHEYAEEKLGRPVWTHEFSNRALMDELQALSKDDFMSIVYEGEVK